MSVPDQREIAAEEKLLNEPLYQNLRPRALEFVERLQRAATVEEWVYLHRDLLIEFGARKDAIDDTLPAARQRVRAKIRELARHDPKRRSMTFATSRRSSRGSVQQELVARASQHTLRQVGQRRRKRPPPGHKRRRLRLRRLGYSSSSAVRDVRALAHRHEGSCGVGQRLAN